MAKGFDRLHVKSAVKSHNKFNLDQTHLTTMAFGQVMPLYFKELTAGDKFNVGAQYFSRMAPLVKPTYGKFNFKTMAAFVPFHQVAYDADAWIAGKTTWEGITPKGRFICMYDIVNLFENTSFGTVTFGSASDYDFSFVGSNGTTYYWKLTTYGKYVFKVLCALGYTYPQNVDLQTSSAWVSRYGNATMQSSAGAVSAYPLLCFAKAYNDYMSQSQRYNTSWLTDFLRKVKYDVAIYGEYDSSNGYISASAINNIMKNIKLCYENDYFTSAWQWPNSALNTPESLGSKDINDSGISGQRLDFVQNTKDNDYLRTLAAPWVYGNTYTDVTIAQRSLDWLRSFDDWVRRNNYSGSRVVQQIYSRFGVKPDDYKSHYAEIIATDSMPIQVGDVTATTAATGQFLGDYAGKGIMSSKNGISYHASDKGFLMILGWFTVVPMMSYGFDRSVLRSHPLDYYTPEFDGLGANAISFGEVYTDPKNPISTDTTHDYDVFGFTERYNEYRFGRDQITGDFREYDSGLGGMNTWHTGRLLTAVRAANEMIAQSSSMNTLPQYDSEFQRMFSIATGVDPFYLTCHFNVSAVRPMLSLNQVPNLGEGDVNVPRNGNEIN